MALDIPKPKNAPRKEWKGGKPVQPVVGTSWLSGIDCPKCHGTQIEVCASFGGPAVYRRLHCQSCGFDGGRVRDYYGEEDRVTRELKERFVIGERRDAVHEFVNSILGPSKW